MLDMSSCNLKRPTQRHSFALLSRHHTVIPPRSKLIERLSFFSPATTFNALLDLSSCNLQRLTQRPSFALLLSRHHTVIAVRLRPRQSSVKCGTV